jgi:hypothetical protein
MGEWTGGTGDLVEMDQKLVDIKRIFIIGIESLGLPILIPRVFLVDVSFFFNYCLLGVLPTISFLVFFDVNSSSYSYIYNNTTKNSLLIFYL